MTTWRLKRREMLAGTAAAGGLLLLPGKAPAQGGAKPFQGVSLNVACWSGSYPKFLADYIPEFEAASGIKVNYDTPSFPVYNQRADLELSTKGSAYDVLNITYIYTSRWIGAGWFTPLEPFLRDPAKTAPGFAPDDFIRGAIDPLKDRKGVVHGIPWTADATVGCAARFDMMQKAGFAMPATFDELMKMLAATSRKEGISGYANEANHHWTLIPYLQGFGGNVFRGPPDDLMPTLDTQEAIEAADFYGRIVRDFGVDGMLTFLPDQAVAALRSGRTNYMAHAVAFLAAVGDPAVSKAAATVAYAPMPSGPKGYFPGTASHGWGIPTGARNKDASWAFIQWATSPVMFRRMLIERGYGGVTRTSVVETPEFRQKLNLNGYDVAKLFVDVLDHSAARGYMAYRTVHVFPQAGQNINKAIENIATGQLKAKEAMAQAQTNLIADLKRAGVQL